MPQQLSQNHVYNLPTGYRFAMASVVDDAKKKGQEAKLAAEDFAKDVKGKAETLGQEAKAKASGGAPFGKIELYSPQYFALCTLGGTLACGITHAAVTPLDLVKCRRQVDPGMYKSNAEAFSKIYRAEGLRGNFTGWGPTLVGYSFQGAGKYGLYEVFKKKYADFAGEENAHKYRTTLYLAASASAEFFADILLCPWEAIKVRMQTTIPPFARGTLEGWSKITSTEGTAGLFKGLQPLWGRQIPYTMMKFASFERVVEYIYSTLPKPKSEYGKLVQTEVSFVGGYIAGIFCALVSHPADVMVSKLNSERQAGESAGAAMSRIYNRIGFSGLWNGLPVRIVMIGTLTGLQWLIYDSFKLYCGFPTTGSAKK